MADKIYMFEKGEIIEQGTHSIVHYYIFSKCCCKYLVILKNSCKLFPITFCVIFAQKVAIARAFYKPAQFAILDEPSSALDPIAEYKLNQNMVEIAKEKTVVFISHRVWSASHGLACFRSSFQSWVHIP